MMEMTDRKPYILRAIYQWLLDNDCTPHLVIAYPGAGWVSGVPSNLLQDDTLVLNISQSASPDCVIENDVIYFTTRFSGQSHSVSVSMEAVAALIARENNEGIFFDISENLADGPQKVSQTKEKKAAPSHLKIVK